MKSGDIVLFRSEGPGLLRWLARRMGMKYYHVGLAYIDECDLSMWVYEATMPTVRKRELGLDEAWDFAWPIAVTDEQRAEAIYAAEIAWLTYERYSPLKAAIGILHWLARKHFRWPVLPLAVFCSEFVSRCWQEAGVTLCMGLSYPLPDDIAESPRVEILEA